MTLPIQVKRRNTGGTGAPASLLSGELAFNAVGNILYIGMGDNGSGVATSIVTLAGAGAFILSSLIGAVSGVAPLDATGKVPLANLPSTVVGSLNYQGTWNASTNNPNLVSGTGTKGFYYKVSVPGSTTIDGINQWNVGDIIAFDGTTWDKIDGIASEVLSVAGRTGAVTITSADLTDATVVGRALLTAASVAAQRAALRIDSQTTVADAAYAVLLTDVSVQYTSLTAARIVTLPQASTLNPGQRIVIGDRSGACSSTNPLTINVNGTGANTINGATSYVLNQAYGQVTLEVDGASKWVIHAIATPTIDGGTF